MASDSLTPIGIATRAVVTLALLAAGIGGTAYLYNTKPKPDAAPGGAIALRVGVVPVERQHVKRRWRGFGTARALDRADIPARVTAVVEHRPADVEAGRVVLRGDLLVQLDDSDYRQQVEIAQRSIVELEAQMRQLRIEKANLAERVKLESEELAIAQSELDRAVALREDDVATRREVDAARREWLRLRTARLVTSEQLEKLPARLAQMLAQKQRLSANLELAQLNQQRCRITSPIHGVIQSVDVQRGENVAPGQRVARVVDPTRIEVPLRLPASARPHLTAGDPVQLISESTGLRWTAAVSRVEPENDESTRTLGVYVEMDQGELSADRRLAPGVFVSGTVTASAADSRWVVPHRSVRDGRVYLVENETVRGVPVKVDFVIEGERPETGLPDDQWLVLEDGPELAGRSLIVDAARSFNEGGRVEAYPLLEAAKGNAP